MPANTPHRILELIAWLSGRGLSQRVISRITGVSQGGKSKVLSHVRETVRAIQSHMGIGWGWPHQGNTVPSSSRIRVKLIRRTGFLPIWSKDVWQQLGIAQDVQSDAPDWLLIIAPDPAYGHGGSGTGSISTGLMWYLLMSPGSAFTTEMVVPEFVGM